MVHKLILKLCTSAQLPKKVVHVVVVVVVYLFTWEEKNNKMQTQTHILLKYLDIILQHHIITTINIINKHNKYISHLYIHIYILCTK